MTLTLLNHGSEFQSEMKQFCRSLNKKTVPNTIELKLPDDTAAASGASSLPKKSDDDDVHCKVKVHWTKRCIEINMKSSGEPKNSNQLKDALAWMDEATAMHAAGTTLYRLNGIGIFESPLPPRQDPEGRVHLLLKDEGEEGGVVVAAVHFYYKGDQKFLPLVHSVCVRVARTDRANTMQWIRYCTHPNTGFLGRNVIEVLFRDRATFPWLAEKIGSMWEEDEKRKAESNQRMRKEANMRAQSMHPMTKLNLRCRTCGRCIITTAL